MGVILYGKKLGAKMFSTLLVTDCIFMTDTCCEGSETRYWTTFWWNSCKNHWNSYEHWNQKDGKDW